MFEQLALTYNYSYGPTTTSGNHKLGAFIGYIVLAIVVVVILEIIGLWNVFQKAGQAGWKAIIPVYNYWTLFEISGKPGWWSLFILLSIVPFGGFVVLILYILAMLALAKRFGKSTLFAVFGLVVFAFVGFLMLGLGQDKYQPLADDESLAKPGSNPTA